MRAQFLFSAILFHTVFVVSCALFVKREVGRLREGRSGLVGDLWALALLALGSAVVLCMLAPPCGFTAMRLLAQALFGELPLLGVVLAGLHLRARRTTAAIVLGSAVIALLAVYVEAYHREPQDLRVRLHDVDLRGGAPETGRFRIVHLSDLQTDRVGPYEERALREALRQKPDLIVMTGDFVQPRLEDTRGRTSADLRALVRRLDFRAPLGVYAVQGDVDREWPGVLRNTPIRCLTSEVVEVGLPGGRRLGLVGLSVEQSRGDDPSVPALLRRVPDKDLRLVFGHRPDFVMSLAGRARVDLALAGHTHGGQVVVPGFGPPLTLSHLPRRYASGLNVYEGILLHVSPGVGMERLTAPQVRFLCPPEVSVLDVRY
jgi:predicted MPP superfamily phosphohydrolase